MACRRASIQLTKPAKGHLTIGSWNTRGLGAPYGKDQAAKFKAISHLLDERKWNAALLTDVKFPEDGFREFYVGHVPWLLIHVV